ncbi:MAG: PEP/pyruvate-binding domain-containing protein [Thermoplasmata archaeon]
MRKGDTEPVEDGFRVNRLNNPSGLMRFKISDILLVSSLYDAFILEEDRGLSEQIFGEYRELELTASPRVSRVSSVKEAERELCENHYDLVLCMTHLIDLGPVDFGRKAKELHPGIPVVLLAMDKRDIEKYHGADKKRGIDKVFFWNGDSSLFLAIIKYFEDLKNAEQDILKGMVQVILVIEDSARYQSMFLPLIYKEVMRQTRSLVEQSLNEHEKLRKRRARPKIFLAESYQEAVEVYKKYEKNILAIISDVAFPKNGTVVNDAGFEFIETMDRDIPVIMQSSQTKYRKRSEKMGLPFLDKNSETMLQDLRNFFTDELGFGDFVFKLPDGNVVGTAENMDELVEMFGKVPYESLVYHGKRNDFSIWLMARGEFELAKELRPKKTEDFDSHEEFKNYLVDAFTRTERKRQLGVITDFSRQKFEHEQTFTRLGGGSLGGKGRGIAFMASLLRRNKFAERFPDNPIRIPETLVLGTEEFERFIDENGLRYILQEDMDDDEVAVIFTNAELSSELKDSLRSYLNHVETPLAVRSSSLLEDSYNQPFAGIYATYILPNNHPHEEKRLNQLCETIKLVYASSFFKRAKAYIRSTLLKAEEEKMAVVIQKLVGNVFNHRFYPIFSGVALSYNYYPLPPLKRQDGIINAALGLGRIIVEGGQVFTFSPERPNSIPGLSSPSDIFNNSQRRFYSLDMSRTELDLWKDGEESSLLCQDISEAENDGTLDHLASVYISGEDIIRDGPNHHGTKIVTFAPIIKHKQYPLTEILKKLLEIGEKGMGGPVEIEFANNIDEDGNLVFYILQIRPYLSMREHDHVVIEDGERKGCLTYSSRALGNGKIDDIYDIVYVSPETFDRSQTVNIAREIGEMNEKINGRPYLLIGPGRWGSNDNWLGIPVDWGHIAGVRAIVETPIMDIRVDPSQGSHFFHNITSLGIPYLTIAHNSKEDFVDWTWLDDMSAENKGQYVRHLSLSSPLLVKVNGKAGHGMIKKVR